MSLMDTAMGALAREARPRWSQRAGDDSRLVETASFGADPGGLRMLSHTPPGLAAGAPLVVVLHGCTQTAAGYDRASGWSELAERLGFALLLPEQRVCNNPNRCFNWFEPADISRGGGEVASIHAMVQHALRVGHGDSRRVFVTGLSAGGAMTAALLATYPETFAAGAIIAGLPFGCASGSQQAFERMMKPVSTAAQELGDRVRAASAHRGPWPRVTIWHGTADTVVRPSNAAESARQWADVHGLGDSGALSDRLDGHARRTWRGADGQGRVELVLIEGMGHATPIAPHSPDPDQRCGAPAPHVVDVGVSSTARIARFFGLAPAGAARAAGAPTRPEPLPPEPHRPEPRLPAPPFGRRLPDVGRVIGDALRAAGLARGP